MVVFCFIYLIVPNLFLVVREWFIAFTLWLKKKGYIHVKEFQYLKHCELKRREFLNGHRNNIVAKKKMQLLALRKQQAAKDGQIAPELDVKVFNTTFELRASRRQSQLGIRHIFPVEDRDEIKKTLARVEMTKIMEEASG